MAKRRLQTRLQQIVLGVIVALITLAFVITFGQPQGGGGPGVVAEVDGEEIPRDSYEFFRLRNLELRRQFLPDGADEAAFADLIDRDTIASLVQRYVLAQEAHALGFRVSEEELAVEVCSQGIFPDPSQCDPEILERFVARSPFNTQRSYTDELRRDLLIRKFRRLVGSPIRLSTASVEETLRRDQVKLRLRYATARSAGFRGVVSVSDSDAQAFAEVEAERIERLYDDRIGEFQREEQVHARHILLTGSDASERAAELRVRLEAGEEFSALAAELSQDAATRDQGGDLGFFPRGRMLAAFDRAAFDTPTGELSDPVETERGVHLIRVEERRPALSRGLDEVEIELARELVAEDGARAAARKAAERMSELLRQGRDFAAAALEAGLPVEETGPLSYRDSAIPGIGRLPGLRETAFALRPEKPASPRVFGTGETFYLISLLDRVEPDAETLAAGIAPARERMLQAARAQLFRAWYSGRVRALEEAGRISQYALSSVSGS